MSSSTPTQEEQNQQDEIPKFIDITVAVPALAGEGWKAKLVSVIESALGYKRIRILLDQAAATSDDGEKMHCTDRIFQLLNITIDHRGVLEAIPKTGSAVVIANHPFGGVDAISLCSLCAKARIKTKDAKLLANSVVYKAPKYANFLLPLKILKEKNARRHNIKTLKKASDLVKEGGLLGVFPAGKISRNIPEEGYTFTDAEWSTQIARIALKNKAPVIPIRYFGKTPLWFNIIGNLCPFLRPALIPLCFLKMKNQTFRCRAGASISYEELSQVENPTQYIRDAVYNIQLES